MDVPIRKHPRIYVEVPASLSHPAQSDVFVALLTHQLGRGGCMVKGLEGIHAGRVVNLILDLDGVQVSAISQVLYECRDRTVTMAGMKFVDIEPEDLRILDAFIARRLRNVGPEGRDNPLPQPSPS